MVMARSRRPVAAPPKNIRFLRIGIIGNPAARRQSAGRSRFGYGHESAFARVLGADMRGHRPAFGLTPGIPGRKGRSEEGCLIRAACRPGSFYLPPALLRRGVRVGARRCPRGRPEKECVAARLGSARALSDADSLRRGGHRAGPLADGPALASGQVGDRIRPRLYISRTKEEQVESSRTGPVSFRPLDAPDDPPIKSGGA